VSELAFPWIELALLLPLVGSAWVASIADPHKVRSRSITISMLTLALTLGGFLDFSARSVSIARDPWDVAWAATGVDVFAIDTLNGPLLPLTALLFALTILATLRAAAHRFSFGSALMLEGLALATLVSRPAWLVFALLALGVVPPYFEQRRKGRSTRIYVLHMALFIGAAGLGLGMMAAAPGGAVAVAGVALLTVGLLVRCGVAPFHCWVTDQYERGSFGTALLLTTPMLGAYGVMRLVLPVAPHWVLYATAVASLATAVYAASMALVQREARRFFALVCVGHSALLLVGLDIATPVALTGALCVWLSAALALTGFGLTLRSVEARAGRLSLGEYHGLYEHVPVLASFFLLTGLASVGFPGTIGFIGSELLFEGALGVSVWGGVLLVSAAALNGLAILHAYFRIFTGREYAGTIDLRIRPPERAAVLILTLLILGGGFYPQPGVASRFWAANELIATRAEVVGAEPAAHARAGEPFPSTSFFSSVEADRGPETGHE